MKAYDSLKGTVYVRNKYTHFVFGKDQQGRIGANTNAASHTNTYPDPAHRGRRNLSRNSEPSNIGVVAEEFAVSSDDMEMFGVLDKEGAIRDAELDLAIAEEWFP